MTFQDFFLKCVLKSNYVLNGIYKHLISLKQTTKNSAAIIVSMGIRCSPSTWEHTGDFHNGLKGEGSWR